MHIWQRVGLSGLLFAGLLGASSPARAADCASNVLCSATIAELYASPADDQIYVDLAGSTPGLTCAPVGGKYFVMALNSDVKRATWQLLVASFLAGKAVTVRLNASSSQCIIQYVVVSP